VISIRALQRRLQRRAGGVVTTADALDLAEALRERLPDFVDEDSIRYETADPSKTAEEVSELCAWISVAFAHQPKKKAKPARKAAK
jgi:hypothetical protein